MANIIDPLQRAPSAIRYLGAASAAAAVAIMAFVSAPPPAAGQAEGGQFGFVVTHFAYALSRDASETGACPNGMTRGIAQIFQESAEGQRREAESDQDYSRRSNAGAAAVATAPNGQNLCMNPEAGAPDPNFKTVSGENVPAEGIDLDGQDSRASGRAAAGTCAHDDFRGMNGERGIDNQFFRLVGCSNSFQSTGQSNTFEIVMYAGEFGILLTLGGVDDLRNDNEVQVGFYASADPMELSPTREALSNATYAIDQDPRFRASANGRIVNGVLTSDPVDVRFHMVVNSIRLERPLDEARVRMNVNPDGSLEGVLAGYTPVEALYDLQYGFRNGTDGAGNPANLRLRVGSATGQARVLGHTCNGAYYAMQNLADAHRDPQTGRCGAISTQYRITAIPAFVVDAPTSSVNAVLDGQTSR